MSMDDLVRACPPARGERRSIAWEDVESRLGSAVPTDYKELVEVYGPGSFAGFLSVLQPNSRFGAIDLERQKDEQRQVLRTLQAGGESIPYAIDNLLPVAKTGNGDVIYWLCQPGATPDTWTLVMNEARGPEWTEFEGGIVEFLAAVLSRRVRIRIFPSDFPGRRPAFTGYGVA